MRPPEQAFRVGKLRPADFVLYLRINITKPPPGGCAVNPAALSSRGTNGGCERRDASTPSRSHSIGGSCGTGLPRRRESFQPGGCGESQRPKSPPGWRRYKSCSAKWGPLHQGEPRERRCLPSLRAGTCSPHEPSAQLTRAALALARLNAAKYSGGKPACGVPAAALHVSLRRRAWDVLRRGTACCAPQRFLARSSPSITGGTARRIGGVTPSNLAGRSGATPLRRHLAAFPSVEVWAFRPTNSLLEKVGL